MNLFVVTIIVASCSMIYELVLAQCMSILYGASTIRFSLTIGLFLFSLGMGTLAYERVSRRFAKDDFFIYLEIVLSCFGSSAPILIMYTSSFKLGQMDIGFYIAHFWIIVIGVLTGMEIPSLLDKGEVLKKVNNQTFVILALDFLGTFLGVGIFLFLLYPKLGIFHATFFTALANLLAAFMLWRLNSHRKIFHFIAILCVSAAIIAAIVLESDITRLLTERVF